MKIGIDARMYGPTQGGLGRYIQELITHLEKINTNHEFVIFLRQENFNEYQPKNPKFKKVLADIPWYGWAEQIKLPGIIKKQRVDLMHFPHWNIPLTYRRPFVTTIHDLLLLHYPSRRSTTLGPIKYWIKNLAFKIILRHAIKHARHIITPSRFTAQDIIKNFGTKPQKIKPVYLAPSTPTGSQEKQPMPNPDITKPYILYVGVAYPHKNLETLLKAWKIYQEKYGADYQLVLAGKTNYFYNRLKKENPNPNVIYTGFISDQDLGGLYQNAALYVFPSLYEGFGLPPLEAMRYGVPVISSNATCLPEILQDACLYFDPKNPKEIATAINRVITNPEIKINLAKKSQKLLTTYRWATTARQTLDVYNSN